MSKLEGLRHAASKHETVAQVANVAIDVLEFLAETLIPGSAATDKKIADATKTAIATLLSYQSSQITEQVVKDELAKLVAMFAEVDTKIDQEIDAMPDAVKSDDTRKMKSEVIETITEDGDVVVDKT